MANMRIDGVGAPIETDVLFADNGSIVLEQELNFLKLGRGVSIDVPGRGERRGRIGSVELRHGPLDVPTLVFGILLDGEAEVREVVGRGARSPRLAGQSAGGPCCAGFRSPLLRPLRSPGPRQPRVSAPAFVLPKPQAAKPTQSSFVFPPPSSESEEPDFVPAPSALVHVSALGKAFVAWLALVWSASCPP